MLENETIELNDEELEKVSGGENCNNPRGLKHGDTVTFFFTDDYAKEKNVKISSLAYYPKLRLLQLQFQLLLPFHSH